MSFSKCTFLTRSEPDFGVDETIKAVSAMKSRCAYPEMSLPTSVYKQGSMSFLTNLTIALNVLKERLELPESWVNVAITAIYKNKGSRKILEFYRGIFLTIIASKILEKLIKSRIEPQLEKVNKLQCGSRSNRGPCDSLFLINGMIDHAKYLNSELFFTFYDYTTCFDSIWLEESMIVLWDLGIRNELFSLIFKLNESSIIKVKSPYGMTKPFSCPRIVKQGTVLGPPLCSSSTAQLCDQNNQGGVMIGSSIVNDIIYVDDTTDINTNIVEHVDSHNEVVNFSLSKGLTLNPSKCVQLIVNQKSTTPTPTLKIGDDTVSQVPKAKVVGDVVNGRGTNVDMIDDRVKRGLASIVSTLSVCNEVTMGMSFIESALLLHHSVVLQTMLNNCQSWTNLSLKDIKRLEVVQLRHLKRIVRAPSSTPNVFVFLEMGVLPLIYHIHMRQLGFLHHILHLTEDDPVKQMYDTQLLLPYEKNWSNKIHSLLLEYNLEFSTIFTVSKASWKEMVRKVVSRKAFSRLETLSSSMAKVKLVKYQSFSCQQYLREFEWKSASILFKLRGRVADCKANRKSSLSQEGDSLCRACGVDEETQEHIINCEKVSLDDKGKIDITMVYRDLSTNDPVIRAIIERYDLFIELIYR